jgi:hypothetical protein
MQRRARVVVLAWHWNQRAWQREIDYQQCYVHQDNTDLRLMLVINLPMDFPAAWKWALQ